MQTLNIQVRSIFYFVIIWPGSALTIAWFLFKLVGRPSIFPGLIISMIVVYCAYQLTKKLVDGELKININNTIIAFEWKRMPILTNVQLFEIKIHDISSYKFTKGVHFSILIINLKNGNRLRIEGPISSKNKNDELKIFVKRLRNIVSK